MSKKFDLGLRMVSPRISPWVIVGEVNEFEKAVSELLAEYFEEVNMVD